ncbi:MAG: hypothetical protein ACLPTZ_27765 [Beijerinckiaceae bacterium]
MARHRALKLACLAFIQAVTRATSGISEEQSRMASGVQAARCSAVPWAALALAAAATLKATTRIMRPVRPIEEEVQFETIDRS